jgi:hypothetical protein
MAAAGAATMCEGYCWCRLLELLIWLHLNLQAHGLKLCDLQRSSSSSMVGQD